MSTTKILRSALAIAVLAACGDRTETWLSPRVQEAYLALFELGALHTVEAYAGTRLVGGAFGIALGSVCTIEKPSRPGSITSRTTAS